MYGKHLLSIFSLEKNADTIELVVETETINVSNTYLIETTIANYVDKGLEVILNLRKVNYISSTALGMLLTLTLKFEEAQKSGLFKIIYVNEKITKILTISNIYDKLPIKG